MKEHRRQVRIHTHVHAHRKRIHDDDTAKRLMLAVAVLVAAVIVVFAYAASEQPAPSGADSAYVDGLCVGRLCVGSAIGGMYVSTDRQLYRSGDYMWVNVTVESAKEAAAHVRVHGLNARGLDRVDVATEQNLTVGRNEILFGYKLPICSSCSGVGPGLYLLTAEVSAGGEYQARNITIEIQR